MRLTLKMRALYSVMVLFFMGSCSKQPGPTVTLNLDLSPSSNPLSNKSSVLKPDSTATFTGYAPIHIFLTITNSSNDKVYYNGLVDLSSVYKTGGVSPAISVNVDADVSSLNVTGYYVASGLQNGQTPQQWCLNKNTAATETSTFSSSASDDKAFFTSIELTGSNAVKIEQTGSKYIANINIPALTSISFEKFAFTVNEDTTPCSSCTVNLLISDSNNSAATPVIDPCTMTSTSAGIPFSGKTDSSGRIATNLPMVFSDDANKMQAHLQLQVVGNTTKTFDLVNTTPSAAATASCYNSPGINALNSKSSLPIFWSLNMRTGVASAVNPNTESYLNSTEVYDTNYQSICQRLVANFNPRFPDLMESESREFRFSHLYPIDPTVNSGSAYYLLPASAGPPLFLKIDPSDTGTGSGATNLNPRKIGSIRLTNPSVNQEISNQQNNKSINATQKIKMWCSIHYFIKVPVQFVSLVGPADFTEFDNYEDCTQYDDLSHVYFTVPSAPSTCVSILSTNTAPSSCTLKQKIDSLFVKFYYGDEEGYRLTSDTNNQLDPKIVPSILSLASEDPPS